MSCSTFCASTDEISRERRSLNGARLEALDLNGVHWQTPETFDDGEALFEAVCAHELEWVVAKRRGGRYLPGERGWVKTKNRAYWRHELERESSPAREPAQAAVSTRERT
jgi:ATP-dependent DNA ligase